MKNKKYYILYKTITNEEGKIIDLDYIAEYERQVDILKDYNITFRDIKKMINNNFLKDIKTHKNYTIIKE